MSRGRFITFEGGEGAGKSTQVRLLADALAARRIAVLRTREPGGAPGAEEIRHLLVNGPPDRWDAQTEALLVVAARRNHLATTVWPALNAGSWVISDRFADSTMAYQGYGHGLPLDRLAELHRFAADDFAPDLTLILDLPVAEGLARATARLGATLPGKIGVGGENRFERMGTEFHERLRQGFLAIAREEPQRCVVIDASAAVDSVHQTILAAVRERLAVVP